MCGRFALKTPSAKIAKLFHADLFEEFNEHYNIAPAARIPVVQFDAEKKTRVIKRDYWGLVPYWAKNTKIAYSTMNARADTVAEKPSFRRAFQKMRCLILMDGFFEWERSTKPSQPYYFSMKDEQPFACAGLYETWKVHWIDEEKGSGKKVTWPLNLGGREYNQGDILESCSIITTEANSLMSKIHDRMPVILDPKDFDTWLDPQNQDQAILKPLLKPYPPAKMQMWPVARTVNKVGDDDSVNCLKKIQI